MIAATFAIYILGMLLVGIIAFRRTANLSDYILGGRRLNSFVTALSAEASDMSGWLLLGLPGYAYAAGCEALWLALGLLAGTYLNWRFVAARLRDQTFRAGDALTLPEFLETRFQDRSRLLRLISGIFILIFFMFYTASGLVAGGKLFASVFGLPYGRAVVLGASVIIVYTFLGGFLAVCWTDCIQGLLMLLALTCLPVMILQNQGGWQSACAAIRQVNPALLSPFTTAGGQPLPLITIVSLLGWGLGYFGQPHILTRFMAIRSSSEIPRARQLAMGWVLMSLAGAFLIGLLGTVALKSPLAVGADTEKVFIALVQALMHPVPAGICLAAILAAVMSTADSQLLVSSSVLAEDFYKGLFRKNASRKELVWAGRLAVAVISVFACLLAMNPQSMVLELVAYAWAGFGAAFGPVLLMSLFWKRTTRNGALAGIIFGGLTVIIWKRLQGGIFDLYEIVPGFILSLAAIAAFSLAGSNPVDRLQRLEE